MDKTRWGLGGAVVVLIGLAVWLSREDDQAQRAPIGGPDEAVVEAPEFPRHQGRRKRVRANRVRRAPLDTERARPNRPRDGLSAAVVPPDGSGAVFVEVNAIRHSPVAEKILRCRQEEGMGALDAMKEQTGIDPFEDVDRVALTDQVFGVSGFFNDLKIQDGIEGDVYGEGAKLYEMPANERKNGRKDNFLAVVGEDLILIGDDPDAVKAAVDRAEGRSPPAPPMQFAGASGEIYGQMGQAFLAGLFAEQAGNPLADRLAEVLQSGTVRMNVGDDVSMSIDLQAESESSGDDLARAVGGALAGLRMEAQADGRDRLAKLLEHARVQPMEGGQFGIDVAVPGAFFLDAMGCDEEGNPIDRPRKRLRVEKGAEPADDEAPAAP